MEGPPRRTDLRWWPSCHRVLTTESVAFPNSFQDFFLKHIAFLVLPLYVPIVPYVAWSYSFFEPHRCIEHIAFFVRPLCVPIVPYVVQNYSFFEPHRCIEHIAFLVLPPNVPIVPLYVCFEFFETKILI